MRIKILLLLAFVLSFFSLKAQDYKVFSVEPLPFDMTAREHIKQDERGRQCALFRIVTQNIAPELREGFHFECDWNSFVVARTLLEGEIWVWVSPGIKTLKIKHEKLGPWDLHLTQYLSKVESLFTYRIVLQGTTNDNKEVAQQYLTFQITPTNAMLEVDGEIWPLSSRGTARRRVNEGMYHYKVTALDCEDVESMVAVFDSAVVVSLMLKLVSTKPENQQSTAQTVQPKIEQPKVEQPVPQKTVGSAFFVMANAAYSFAPQASFGLTVGSVKHWGWYVSVGTNFKYVGANYNCAADGTIISNTSNHYHYTKQETMRFSATAGAMVRIYKPVFAYFGAGYGVRNLLWHFEGNVFSGIAKNTAYSHDGVAIDAGLMFRFGHFSGTYGVQTVNFGYVEFKLGLGVNF